MTIKLALLKSGEEVISDIGEMVTDKKTVVGYYFTNPCRAILTTSEDEYEADDEIEEHCCCFLSLSLLSLKISIKQIRSSPPFFSSKKFTTTQQFRSGSQ